LPPIKHTQLFDFDSYKEAIKDIKQSTTDFGKATDEVLKRLTTSQGQLTGELREYVKFLQSMNVTQNGAADTLKKYSTQIDETVKAQNELKAVSQGLASIVNLQNASVKELEAEYKGLQNQLKSLKPSQADYQQQITAINGRLKEVVPQIQAFSSSLKNTTTTVNAAESSYKAMQAQLGQLRTQLRDMPNAFNASTGAINTNNKEAVALLKNITQLDTTLKGADKSMGLFFRNVGNYEGSFGKLGEHAKEFGSSLLLAVGISTGIAGIFQTIESSIEAFDKEQDAINRFKNTLDNAAASDAFPRLASKAEALAKEFKTFEDRDIIAVFDKLVTYGKLTENQISELTTVIINYSAKQKISLEDATDVITRALEGQSRGLKQYGIETRNAHDVTERFGIIMSQLGPRVEGAAKAFGETTAGQIKQTQVSIEELKESIGEKLQPVVREFYKDVRAMIDPITGVFKTAAAGVKYLYDGIVLTIKAIGDIISFNPGKLLKDIKADEKKYADEKDKEINERKLAELSQEKQEEANRYAEQVAADILSKKGKERKQLIDEQNKKLKEANDLYIKMAGNNKTTTEEMHKQGEELQKLQAVAAALNQKPLGLGDPNTPPKVNLDELRRKQDEYLKAHANYLV
jgi:predicted  nucleic acid-binding Zn-ribbon protein